MMRVYLKDYGESQGLKTSSLDEMERYEELWSSYLPRINSQHCCADHCNYSSSGVKARKTQLEFKKPQLTTVMVNGGRVL
jgi:hypothetical protein